MAAYDRILYMGSRDRAKQIALGVPGGKATGQPGVLVLDTGAATPTQYKLFVTTAGVLRATSGTAFGDADGSAVGAAATITLDQAYDNGATINGAISSGTAIKLGGAGASDNLSIYHDATDLYLVCNVGDINISAAGGDISFSNENLVTTGTLGCYALTCRGITNTVTAINSTLAINIGADSVNLTLGASGATDSYIQFDGTNLKFYDSTYGATITLSALASGMPVNPTVSGDLTITEGKLTWTDGVAEVAGAWSFASTTTDAIAITAVNTTGNILSLTDNAITTNGAMVYLASSLTAGYFVEVYNGVANVFTVGRYGAVVIGGNAGSDVLTLTAGYLQMTDGDIDMDEGKIEVDTVTDETSYVKKNLNASAAAVVEIENTHTGSTGSCLLLDQNGTGNSIALDVSHDGDLAAINIAAGAARTGDVIAIAMANQLAQKAINITGAATAADNAGVVDVTVTGATAGALFYAKQSTGIPAATSHLFWGTSQGSLAAANVGATAYFEEIGAAQAGSYTLYATSTANNGALINTAAVAMYALKLTGPAAQVQSILYVDGTTGTGWDGATGVGMVQIDSDAANTFLHANTSCLLINAAGTTAASQLGVGLRLLDTTTAGAGTSYAAYISTTNNAGLYVGIGAVGGSNVILRGIQAQTASMLTVDGTTGTGWEGAATTGMVNLSCDGATLSTTASVLRIAVGTGTPVDTAAGYAIRVEDTTTAVATPLTTYAVYISAANNEALKVDDGLAVFDDGICTRVAITDIANPPTNANMISAFGAVTTKTTGFLGLIDDANAGTKLYLCAMVNGKYWQVELTAGA